MGVKQDALCRAAEQELADGAAVPHADDDEPGAHLVGHLDHFLGGLVAGALGGIVGTLGGAEGRARLAAGFGKDRPAALIEDSVAILGAMLVVVALP